MDTVHIALHNHAPTFLINGKPDTGLMLYFDPMENDRGTVSDFAAAGIDLSACGVGSVGILQPDGSLDFSKVDAKMHLILSKNPRIRINNRISLTPSEWWFEKHTGEKSVHYDPYLDQNVAAEHASVSPSSQQWRKDFAPVLAALITHLERHYNEHFLSYQICSGDCGEWSYAWRHYTQSDYSEAQCRGFRRWLEERHPECVAQLPETIIPRDWRRKDGDSPFLDRPEDRLLRLYLEYASWVTSDAIIFFASVAKEALRTVRAEKPVGAFYGYHFPPPGASSAFINSGHHALHRVLRCPDVDYICAPYSYYQRDDGGTFYSQLPHGSLRLHGKLLYSEEDTVTFVIPPVPYRYHADTREKTINVLLRNTLGALMHGGTSWYMDWFGQNWYKDAALMHSIAQTRELARRRLARDNASIAQVAVIVSERTAFCLRHHDELLNEWWGKPMATLHRLGAPIDTFLASDLPRLAESDTATQYRLFVFLDCPDFTDEERLAVQTLRSKMRRQDKGMAGYVTAHRLIWSYKPDVMHGEEAMRHLVADDPHTPNYSWTLDDVRAHARAAGVHLYTDSGDQILAEKFLLAVHTATAGERRYRLPTPCRVTEAFTGKCLDENTDTISASVAKGQTLVWEIDTR